MVLFDHDGVLWCGTVQHSMRYIWCMARYDIIWYEESYHLISYPGKEVFSCIFICHCCSYITLYWPSDIVSHVIVLWSSRWYRHQVERLYALLEAYNVTYALSVLTCADWPTSWWLLMSKWVANQQRTPCCYWTETNDNTDCSLLWRHNESDCVSIHQPHES